MKVSQRPKINRPLAPQPSVRSVVIDNQIGILCHDHRQALARALVPRASLANCLATIPSSAVPSRRPPSVPRGYYPPNSLQFILLQPLCSLFSTSVLCFQSLAASFAKKGGVGIPTSARRTATLWTQIEGRLGKVEARRNEPPDTARATKALVHSSPLRGLAATRGACSRRNQSRNMRPMLMDAKDASMPVVMQKPAAIMPVLVR